MWGNILYLSRPTSGGGGRTSGFRRDEGVWREARHRHGGSDADLSGSNVTRPAGHVK